jgi:hypothetical protein
MAVKQMQELTENFANMVTIDQQDTENEHTHYVLMRNRLAKLKAIISKLQQQPPVKPATGERFPFVNHGSYYWSHGYCVAPKHTSQTCQSKNPGHKEEATWANNLNGSQIGKPQA